MDKIQSFPCRKMQHGEKSFLYQDLISSTQNWLVGEGFEYQEHTLEDGGTLLQIKKSAGWKKFVGMDAALNILFHHVNDTVHVEIGAGRWADKAAIGAASLVIFSPLLVTAGIGAYQQAKMPERIFEHIATYLSQNGEIINEYETPPAIRLPNENEPLPPSRIVTEKVTPPPTKLMTEDDLFEIIDRYSSDDYYKYKDIPSEKLKNSQNYPVDPKDTIIALINTAALRSAKTGMAIGLKGIYWKNDSATKTKKNFLAWDELFTSDIARSKYSKHDIQFAPECEFSMAGCRMEKDILIKLLKEITLFYKKFSADTQQEISSINNSDSVSNKVEVKESKSHDPSLALYIELVPELLALCISADGLVEESEIEIAMALIENEELIENKQTALESLSLNIDKFSTEIKKSKAIFKLKAASLIAKAVNLDNDLYKERLIIIIEGIQEAVSEEGVAETTAIIEAIKNKLK